MVCLVNMSDQVVEINVEARKALDFIQTGKCVLCARCIRIFFFSM
jgi:hypothetical protein